MDGRQETDREEAVRLLKKPMKLTQAFGIQAFSVLAF